MLVDYCHRNYFIPIEARQLSLAWSLKHLEKSQTFSLKMCLFKHCNRNLWKCILIYSVVLWTNEQSIKQPYIAMVWQFIQRCVACDEQPLKINTLFSEKVPDLSNYFEAIRTKTAPFHLESFSFKFCWSVYIASGMP